MRSEMEIEADLWWDVLSCSSARVWRLIQEWAAATIFICTRRIIEFENILIGCHWFIGLLSVLSIMNNDCNY